MTNMTILINYFKILIYRGIFIIVRKVVFADVVDKEGLWYRVLKARYEEEGGVLVLLGGVCWMAYVVV